MTDDGIGKEVRRKKKQSQGRKKQYNADGITRPPKAEAELNEAFAIVFKGAAGTKVLDYLKSITTNRVIGPGQTENTYAYAEGGRWLMGVISTRIKDGEDKKP